MVLLNDCRYDVPSANNSEEVATTDCSFMSGISVCLLFHCCRENTPSHNIIHVRVVAHKLYLVISPILHYRTSASDESHHGFVLTITLRDYDELQEKRRLGAMSNKILRHFKADILIKDRTNFNIPNQLKTLLACSNRKLTLSPDIMQVEPAHEIMVLITQATCDGSGEPAHPRSLARAFAVRTHKV